MRDHGDRYCGGDTGEKTKAGQIQSNDQGKDLGRYHPIEITNHGIENFSEEWFFIRQGEWWLLDGIRSWHSILLKKIN
jgi:hypothetical protein